MDEQLTIRNPRALRERLEELAIERNRPVSALVREAIRRYIAVERFRLLRSKTLPLAEAAGILTDEDVFHSIL